MTMDGLSTRTRQREIQRQLLNNRVRKAVLSRVPAVVREYLRLLFGTALGLAVIAELLRRLADVNPVFLLAAIGLTYAAQLAYYKAMLARDPDFKIPKCRCAGAASDKTEAVLRSKGGHVLGIPNAVLAVGFYLALLALTTQDQHAASVALAVAAVFTSAYAGYVMTARIAALCTNCVSIAAVNLLILLYLLV
jgi:uncharacterized membrane protein